MSNRALILVDVQNDFCPGGSLATERGSEVAAEIASFMESDVFRLNNYSHVVATQDWHIDPGSHFSDEPDFVDSWPVHCKANTNGAAMHEKIDLEKIEAFFRKGEYEAAYSGFEGKADGVLLAEWLRHNDIDSIDVCGIATDHCVRATALDGLKVGFKVRVLSGLCAAVDNARGDRALNEMDEAGADLI
ncbi:isochorismatase family protein [Corynebacterium breve]|uniref:nicotinamidase n=1 Tax=Corynebacterium breve TaxID=3049799 RepID=A0ABY8VE58_9CORY|nr:isochorismatase family protein [Corynebacterium breve]WIM67236.1 isochorismatase family protein [Corynebacterium breve]